MTGRLKRGLVGAGALFIAGQAQADEGRWRISAEAQSRLPLSVGGRLRLETPSRVRFAFEAGAMPLPYASAVDELISSGLGVDQTNGRVFRDVLTGAPALRGTVGWRPWPDRGWYLEAGYESIAFGGGATTQSALAALRALPVELQDDQEGADYQVSSTVHLLELSAGYEWRIRTGVLMRWEVGFAGTVAADVEVLSGDGRPFTLAVRRDYAASVDGVLTDALTTYGFVPTATFGIGYELAGASSPLD